MGWDRLISTSTSTNNVLGSSGAYSHSNFMWYSKVKLSHMDTIHIVRKVHRMTPKHPKPPQKNSQTLFLLTFQIKVGCKLVYALNNIINPKK